MKAVLTVVTMALLAGCAELVPPRSDPVTTKPTGPAHAEQVSAFDTWRLTGRIAVQRADKGITADVEWRQAGDDFDLRIMAPLNQGTFRLSGGARKVELLTPEGETFTAARPEALMQDHLGWSIPLAGTRYWIRGMPDPGTASSQELTDAEGRWTDFEQDRWRVSILDYVKLGELDLPRRLYLARDDLKVRIAIKKWERR